MLWVLGLSIEQLRATAAVSAQGAGGADATGGGSNTTLSAAHPAGSKRVFMAVDATVSALWQAEQLVAQVRASCRWCHGPPPRLRMGPLETLAFACCSVRAPGPAPSGRWRMQSSSRRRLQSCGRQREVSGPRRLAAESAACHAAAY